MTALHQRSSACNRVSHLIAKVFSGITPIAFNTLASVERQRDLTLGQTEKPAVQGFKNKGQTLGVRIRREMAF
ncbi:hypothetical protein GCM10008941_29430 [Rhizomicrobium palustre]